MSVYTTNAYGKIIVTGDAIAQVAWHSALECYGIVDLVSRSLIDGILELFKITRRGRGVRIITSGDRIYVDLNVIMKYGVSIEAVAESLKKTIKYDLERFTGMVVSRVDVNVIGVRV